MRTAADADRPEQCYGCGASLSFRQTLRGIGGGAKVVLKTLCRNPRYEEYKDTEFQDDCWLVYPALNDLADKVSSGLYLKHKD